MSGNSPRAEPQQLPAPEAFSRAINAANSYAPFDSIKILDMDDLYEGKLPKMPIVLTTHDIYQDDWKRCIQVRNSPTFFFLPCLTNCKFYLLGFSSLLEWSSSCRRLRQRWTGSKTIGTLGGFDQSLECLILWPTRR